MKLPHFLAYCARTPWAMDPAAMTVYAALLAKHFAGGPAAMRAADQRDDQQPVQAAAAKASGSAGTRGSIAVINVMGPIVQRASELGMCEAGTGCEDISAALDAAMADSSVSQIAMRYSTPGGSVFGVQELGSKIREARKKKPIVGVADSMAASAGYWLLAQSTEAYVTPGGMVGSIGVYTAHQCIMEALKAEGVSLEFIFAGKYKTERNPFQPLGDEARGHIQAQVDSYYSAFTGAVARGRNVSVDQVRSGMGEGRVLLADDALKAGMVDGVMTFEDVIRKMQGSTSGQRSARAAAFAQAQADIAALS
jgi:signal peptide peptidase SppA